MILPPPSKLSLRLSLPSPAHDPTVNTQDDEFLVKKGDFSLPFFFLQILVEQVIKAAHHAGCQDNFFPTHPIFSPAS